MGFSSWIIVEDQNKTVTTSKTTLVAFIDGNRSVQYSTLQKAISVANTGSNKKVVVIPGSVVNIDKNLTIPSGVSVYVPYEETISSNGKTSTYKWEIGSSDITSASTYGDANATSVTNNRKTLINLTNGADITISSGGALYLGGVCGSVGVVGAYTEINLDAGSKIDCSGTFYCYGYVKEKTQKHGNQVAYKEYYNNSYDEGRLIKINEGGYIRTVAAMFGQKDQSTLLNLDSAGVFPFSLFDFPNLQTYTEINYGSKFYGQVYVLTTSSSMNYPVYQALPVVDSSSALYNMKSGSVAFEYCPSKADYTTNTGITRIYLNGDVEQGFLTVTVSSQNVTTSDKFFPISYKLNLYINNGGKFSTSYKLKFLPGSILNVNNGGTFIINNEVIFYNGSDASKIAGGYTVKTDAELINNGTLKLTSSGKIAAFIQTSATDNSAVLDFTECSSSSAFTVTSYENETLLDVTRTSEGLFVDESEEGKASYQFAVGSKVYSDPSGNICWNGEKNDLVNLNISIFETTYTKNIFAYEIKTADDASGTNAIAVTSGVESTAKEFPLPIGKYVNINVTRAAGATFNDGTSVNPSEWYLISQDINITITPNEGVKLTVKTDSSSGNGQTSFTVLECSSSSGSFYEVATWMGITNESTYVVKGWYFKITYKTGYGTTSLNTSSFSITSDTTGASSKFSANTAYPIDDQYTVYFPRKSSICFTEGTLITLGNGTQKAIENISINDNIMSFSHYSGNFESKPILFIVDHGYVDDNVMILEFSNGTTLELVGIHSLFNLTRKEYSNFDINNVYSFIGEEFLMYNSFGNSYSNDGVKLVSVDIFKIHTKIYSIVSKDNVNAVTNGVLSNTPYVPDTFNIFELDDSLKYDLELMNQDISKYGLYEYEKFKEYIPKSIFDGVNLKYYKVAIEKGYMTEEELLYIMNAYKSLIDSGDIILNA